MWYAKADIVDNGNGPTIFRVPTRAYRDFMDFYSAFCCEEGKRACRDYPRGRTEAAMFLGYNLIGTELHGPYFEDIELDAVVGSVGGGATLRLDLSIFRA